MNNDSGLRISVAVCARNRAGFLSALFESIFSQTIKPYEVIYVDDYSEDETREVLEKYQGKVKTVFLKKHRGLGTARNVALRAASGDIILYVDSDTELPENLIAAVTRNFRESGCAACGGRGIESCIHSEYDDFRKRFFSQDFKERQIKNPPMLMGIVMSYKIDFLRSLGGFKKKFRGYGEDAELGMRMKISGASVLYDPAVFVFHKRTDGFKSLLRVIYKYAYWQSYAVGIHENPDSIFLASVKYFFIIFLQSVWYYKNIKMTGFAFLAGSVKIAGHLAGGFYGKKDKRGHTCP